MEWLLYRVEISLLDSEQADVIVTIVTYIDDMALKWVGVVEGIHTPASSLQMCV